MFGIRPLTSRSSGIASITLLIRWATRTTVLVLTALTINANTPIVGADEAATQQNKAATNNKRRSNDSQPETGPPAIGVEKNQRYSDQQGRSTRCDVYSPTRHPPPGGHPAVIVVHGGGWVSGDKWTVEGYSRRLAGHGIVAITINYRLAPANKFPCQVDDVRQALLWTTDHSERLRIDPDRIGLFGYSAGGHLSALVATLGDESIRVRATASQWPINDPRWSRLPKIRALCVGGPPCDFRQLPIDNTSLAYFLGGSRRNVPEVYVAASPGAHVSPADPPTQIIHGEADLLVPIAGSRAFHQAQVSAGVDSRLTVIENQGHMLTFLNPRTSEKMLEFFAEVFQLHEPFRR